MSLIRFDGSTRSPSAQLFHGLVDWVRGSNAVAIGNADFDDFAPYNAGNHTAGGAGGTPSLTLQNVREGVKGVIRIGGTTANNNESGFVRHTVTKLDVVALSALEVDTNEMSGDDAVQMFVGLTNQAAADVFTTSALTTSSVHAIGFHRLITGAVNVVSIQDGAAVTLIENVVPAGLTAANRKKVLGLRIERVNSTTYRLVPSVDGNIVRSKITNVASTAVPSVAMRPAVVVNHTDDAAAIATDVDWIFFADK